MIGFGLRDRARRSALISLLVALTAPAIGHAAGAGVPVAGDPVTIDAGQVAGGDLGGGVKAYLGVPFAAPPVRENRWRAPQPVAPWRGVLQATTLPPECPQGLRSPSINHYFGEEPVSEDCLYLNIWAPAGAKAGEKLPVVVYIYGGAFNVGSASSPIYSGEPLAKKGVIYVAANYRLGVFGFLSHPALTAESGRGASGNWGFLDQVAALQWVKRNIAAFGGDPANVTLLGQSAGAMSINNLQASPLAKGLFAKTYGMSGATVRGGPGDAMGTPLATAEQAGVKLQETLKASDLAAMRGFSWDKVMAAAQAGGVRAGPSIDGYYLPRSVQSIFEAGQQNDVPVVTGSTADDIGTAVPIRQAKTLDDYQQRAAQTWGDKAPDFLKLWPARNDAEAVRRADEVGRNSGFALGARNLAKLQATTGKSPSYLFMVTRVQPFTPGVKFTDFDQATAGAYHMGDVPYFLGTYEAFNLFRKTRDWGDLDRSLSNAMQDSIVAFARTSDPSPPRVKFPRFDPKAEKRLVFGDAITVETLDSKAQDFLLDTPTVPRAPRAPTAAPAAGAPAQRPTF